MTGKFLKGENYHKKTPLHLRNCRLFKGMIGKHHATGNKIAAGLQASMSLLYLGSGIFLFTSEKASRILPADFIPYAATAPLLYGLFRAFRAWNKIKTKGIRL